MRRAFAAAAASYDAAAVLARNTGARMAERLDYVRLAPRRVADIGCATGDGIRELQRRYPDALPLAIDFARPMLGAVRDRVPRWQRWRGRAPRLVNADVRRLPFAAGTLGLVWSNLMLHWIDDPLPALRELHRTLDVGGLLMFSMLGPDTLKELRATGLPTLRAFHDMHDVGDMLLAAGFSEPVMDMEMVRLTYSRPSGLLRDQRLLGVRDGLFGAPGFRAARDALRAWASQREEGRVAASFEIVYGHAWKAAPCVDADGRAVVRLHRA